MFAHYYDVHSDVGTKLPYASPKKYARRYWPEGLRWEREGDTELLIEMPDRGDVSRDDRRALAARYDGGVRDCDEHCLGVLVDELDALSLAQSTLVVVTSDHGEGLDDHGELTHGYFAYNSTLHVPLIVRFPGNRFGGTRISDAVSLVDIYPSILDWLTVKGPQDVSGHVLPTSSRSQIGRASCRERG